MWLTRYTKYKTVHQVYTLWRSVLSMHTGPWNTIVADTHLHTHLGWHNITTSASLPAIYCLGPLMQGHLLIKCLVPNVSASVGSTVLCFPNTVANMHGMKNEH